tara:strand:- start:182 stop:841 length:660 start_codon:yes stop_codon:yes gene_type:complete
MLKTIKLFLLSSVINTCPRIQPMENFNTTEYIRATWYIQQQQITGYQPRNSLYCVAQTLNLTNKTVPFFDGSVISVFNYGRLDGVNGTLENPKNFTLCARQINQSDPARIINAPCFLPNFLAGPYWVIGAGPKSDFYEWAIVSGGPPTVRYPDGNCSTSLEGTNGSGLWLFTRRQNGTDLIPLMRDYLLNFGYTTSQLLNVTQEGCNYSKSFIKNNIRI